MIRILPVLLLLLSGACSRKSAELSRPAPAPPPAVANDTLGPRSYLALGDSYTIVQNVAESDRFPYLLSVRLQQYGFSMGPVRYIAQTGWTTDELQSAIDAAPGLGRFDLVTLLIGVNDQYRGRDTSTYAPRFTQLLQTAIRLAGDRKERVFVLSIPDYSATPFVPPADKGWVSAEVEAFNKVNRRITRDFGVLYIDITPGTVLAGADPLLLAPDRLHYSGLEHGRWAALLFPEVVRVLR